MNSTRHMTPAERKEFAKEISLAEKLPTHYLQCRTLGHSWNVVPADRVPEFGRLLVFECQRCSTLRDDIFDSRWGTLLARSYRYAEGYLKRRSDPDYVPLTRSALRKALDERVNG